MHLRGRNIVPGGASTVLLYKHKNEVEIDDHTFDMWKTELQKELPEFWESMTNTSKWG